MVKKKWDSRYSQYVAWSPEDQMFVAVCPELDDLSALGESQEDAVKELNVAVDLLLGHLEAEGQTPPEPQTMPHPSGQFRVRIPRTLHSRLVILARREGVSLNSLVTMLLADGSANLSAQAEPARSLKK